MGTILRALISALAWLTLVPVSAGQGGYTNEDYSELGLSFPRARDYEQVPNQPGEEWVVLHFAEKPPKREERRMRPEFYVVWIDWVADPPQEIESEDRSPPAPGTTTTGEAGAEFAKKAPLPPINSLDRFVEQRLKDWDLGRGEQGRERDDYSGRVHSLIASEAKQRSKVGWVYCYERPKRRTIAIIGFCHSDDLKEQSKIWRYTAERMRFTEPEGADLEKLERYYARRGFRDPEYRVRVRSALVRGWKAEDTENFIVVYHTPDQPLLRSILSDIESIREEYLRLFPPAGQIEAVSTVRICKDRDEYMLYGGSSGSAGYWNSRTEELVLYDAVIKEKGKRPVDDNTFIVLYHEAFHQYIHYSAGELPPHSWFNEGHGDYFSGAHIKNGRVRSIGVNPWRIRTVQRAIGARKFTPWKDILHYDQAQYYANAGLHYAQGWSMVYFLRSAKEVQRRDDWSGILDTYFNVLKLSYEEELERLGEDSVLKPEELAQHAGDLARKRALAEAFEGVDIGELERAWMLYTTDLEQD